MQRKKTSRYQYTKYLKQDNVLRKIIIVGTMGV